MPFQSSGSPAPLSPAGRALLALLEADSHLPEIWQATELVERRGTVVVLVDTIEAWSAWVVALYDRADQLPDALVLDHVATASATVHHFPVTVVRGDRLPECGVAA
jgi:hypothetical protein